MPYPKEQRTITLFSHTQSWSGPPPIPPTPIPPLRADPHSKTQRECIVMRSPPWSLSKLCTIDECEKKREWTNL